MTKEKLVAELTKSLKDYIVDNCNLMDIVYEINSYNGELDDLKYYENDEMFFEMFFSNTMEAVRAVSYGEYNYTDKYVKFNAYRNLVSISQSDLDRELEDSIDEIVESLVELYGDVTLDDEIANGLIEIIIDERKIEVCTMEEFKDYIIINYQAEEDIVINEDTLKEDILEEETTMEISIITDSFDDAVDTVETGVSFFKVENLYIVFQ